MCHKCKVEGDAPFVAVFFESLVVKLQTIMAMITQGTPKRQIMDFQTKFLTFFHVVLAKGSALIHFVK